MSGFLLINFIVLLLIFIPLFSFLLLFFFSKYVGYYGVKIISLFNSSLLFLISIYFLFNTVIKGKFFYLTCCYWINIGILDLYWSFTVDFISSIMVFTVSLVSLLVIIFSYEYMINDPFFSRFISLLSVFTFFMVFFVCSDNFIQFFLGWEGIGLCSYFLINFWFSRIQAVKSAFKALIVNRVGDVSLLASFSIIFLLYGSLDFSILSAIIPFMQNEYIFIFNMKFNLLFLIGLFLLIGVLSKSAQIGLHTWLPDAMEGPTPVSALIHAATMVTAGVFLLIRCSFIFEFLPEILYIVSIIGAFTAFFSATIALVQMDIKKLIAYSTCSQLGYMIFSCGISLYSLSLFHLVNHAFFKALLFLSAGSIIHSLNNEQDLRKMGGMLKILPNSYISILIASLSLCGFPFLSGFFSKDLIIECSILGFELENIFCFWLVYCCAFLTVLYSIKLVFLIFLNKFNFFKSSLIYESGLCIYISQVVLLFFSIFSGYLLKEAIIGYGSFYVNGSILELPKSISFFEIECLYEIFYFYDFGFFYLILVKFLPFYSSLLCTIVYYFYFINFYSIIFLKKFNSTVEDINFSSLKNYINSYDCLFYNNLIKKNFIYIFIFFWLNFIIFSFKVLFFNIKYFFNFFTFKLIMFFSNKWYIDYIYNNILVKPFLVLNFNIFFNYFDKGLIELFGPSTLVVNILKLSRLGTKIQFNFISNFLSLIFLLVFLLVFFIYVFKVIFFF